MSLASRAETWASCRSSPLLALPTGDTSFDAAAHDSDEEAMQGDAVGPESAAHFNPRGLLNRVLRGLREQWSSAGATVGIADVQTSLPPWAMGHGSGLARLAEVLCRTAVSALPSLEGADVELGARAVHPGQRMVLHHDSPAPPLPVPGSAVELELWVLAAAASPLAALLADKAPEQPKAPAAPERPPDSTLLPPLAQLHRLWACVAAGRRVLGENLDYCDSVMQTAAACGRPDRLPRTAERRWMLSSLPQGAKWAGREGLQLRTRFVLLAARRPVAAHRAERQRRLRGEGQRPRQRRPGGAGGVPRASVHGMATTALAEAPPVLTSGMQHLRAPVPAPPLQCARGGQRELVLESMRVVLGGERVAWGGSERDRAEERARRICPPGTVMEAVDNSDTWVPPLAHPTAELHHHLAWARLRESNSLLAALCPPC